MTKIIKEFHKSGRYIGTSAHASLLIANVLSPKNKGPEVELTFGMMENRNKWPFQDFITSSKVWGNNIHNYRTVHEISHDKKNKIVSTPASLYSYATAADI